MKKLIVLTFLICFGLHCQAQTLKGMTIGKKNIVKGETTVAGYSGLLDCSSLNDNTVAAVGFLFYSFSLKKENLPDLIEKIENKYNIKFEEHSEGDKYYNCEKDGITYVISPYNEEENISYVFLIGDLKLVEQYDKEQEEIRSNDF